MWMSARDRIPLLPVTIWKWVMTRSELVSWATVCFSFTSFLPSLSLGLQRILFLNNLFCWLLYRSLSPFERMWNSSCVSISRLITSVSVRLDQPWENQSRKMASCRSSPIKLRINRQPYHLRAAFCLAFWEWVYIGWLVKIQFHVFQCTYNFM